MDSIYVEIPIKAHIDRIWQLTQTPELHERWDLRFNSIEYLPSEGDGPQRFLYETRIGMGLSIRGEGESVGESNRADGTRTSALKFWSDHPLSLISKGSGFWQYVPEGDVVIFRTRYDYKTRLGLFGKAMDFLFRPLIGWATAWSFDSLRLWAEKDVQPEQSRSMGLIYLVSRSALALIWFYHGLVPKILFPNTGEVEITVASGFARSSALQVNLIAGIAEVIFSILLVLYWRSKALVAIQIPALLALLAAIAFTNPSIFTQPFQPFTLNISMIALAVCNLSVSRDLPSARNCKRSPAQTIS